VTEPVRVLYVAGLAHSGSTVLARVLGEVEGLFTAGEVYALGERTANGDRCGCGAVLAECPFWTSVLSSAFPDGDALSRVRTERRWILGRTLPSLALGRDRERLDAYRADLARLYRAIAEESGSRVVVDSSKSPTYGSILDRAPGIELYGVHLVRDPRPTSYSWSVDPHYHRTRGFAFGARWTLWNLELEALAARRRRRFVRLRLEDFVRDPVAETRRVLALVGAEHADLPFDDDGRSVRLPGHHMVEGHSSRFDTGVVPIRASTSWKRALSPRRELSTALLASPLQLLYGYPLMRLPAGSGPRRTRAPRTPGRRRRPPGAPG
jgi:Sulfotransferase family